MKFKKSYPPATWTDLKTPAPVIKPPVTSVKWIHGCIKVSQWRRSWSCQVQEENCFATTLELELELPRLGQAGGSAPTQGRDHSPLRSRAAGNIWSCLGAVFVPRFVPVSVCNVFLFPRRPTDQDVQPWDSIVNQAAAPPTSIVEVELELIFLILGRLIRSGPVFTLVCSLVFFRRRSISFYSRWLLSALWPGIPSILRLNGSNYG